MFCIVVIVCSAYALSLYGTVSNILFGAAMVILLLAAIAVVCLFVGWIKTKGRRIDMSKKKYLEASVIVKDSTENFLDSLAEEIEKYQEKGLQVEIQYCPTAIQLTALILAYEEV